MALSMETYLQLQDEATASAKKFSAAKEKEKRARKKEKREFRLFFVKNSVKSQMKVIERARLVSTARTKTAYSLKIKRVAALEAVQDFKRQLARQGGVTVATSEEVKRLGELRSLWAKESFSFSVPPTASFDAQVDLLRFAKENGLKNIEIVLGPQ